MEKVTTVHDLLHDPTLSFSDFCIITTALKDRLSKEEIPDLPELAHLRLRAGAGPKDDPQ